MKNKVILISIDGMRPDGFEKCNNPYIEELKRISSHTLNAKTVFPSVTLPCHMSLFHSVPPERHGTTTNTYMPQVRPVNGLFEQLSMAEKTSVMFFGWNRLREVARPDSMLIADFLHSYAYEYTDEMLTDKALHAIKELSPDFVFLYMVETDEKGGHDNGWMSDEYLRRISLAIDNVKRVIEEAGDEYTVIITADHGGHDRIHGTDSAEDMTIPMFYIGPDFEEGKDLGEISILDIAPTIADIIGVSKATEWEGKSLVKK